MSNILLIGFGPSAVFAYHTLAPRLPETHRIVAVSATEAYWPIASLRAAVVPGWEEKVVAPVDKVLPSGSRHVLLERTSVVELRVNSATLDNAHPEKGFEGTEVEFEFCIIATGTSYRFPCRPAPGAPLSSILSSLRAQQAALATSSSVLILGGGPVGIEYAGEVAAYYDGSTAARGRKRVVVVHPRERFLREEEGWRKAFGEKVEKQLKELGVEVRLGRRVRESRGLESGKVEGEEREFELDDGEKIKADFIFLAHGLTPNSSFCASLSPSVLNSKNEIVTKPTLQVASDDGRYDHIFAIGDVNNFEESKVLQHACNHVPVMAHNLLALLSAKSAGQPMPAAPLKEYVLGSPKLGLSIGHEKGAAQIYGWVIGPWIMKWAKSKHLAVAHFDKTYNVAASA
ncbi:hypothetical protein JCM6882_004823 [Rhodosporidiobolus microsporus]